MTRLIGKQPELDPALLRGWFVVEIGVRQAWPHVTFANNDAARSPAEVRLYIDSHFAVAPPPANLGTSKEDHERTWLLRLVEILNLTVQDATVGEDNSLALTFHGDVSLWVSGVAAPWTTHEVWWLAAAT
jgi:hypothetical protein